MDKRTSEGRAFLSLANNDEKLLFLLEKIYNELNIIKIYERDSKAGIEELQKIAGLQAECLVFLTQVCNKSFKSSNDYDKYLSEQLNFRFKNYGWKFIGNRV